jgi:hypothetical protein
MSTQIAVGLAHGTTSHDHQNTSHQSTTSTEAKHHLDLEQTDVADQNQHSHIKKQLDDSRDFSALQACDSACTAIFTNGWMISTMDSNAISDGLKTIVNQSIIELPTPPPNNLL